MSAEFFEMLLNVGQTLLIAIVGLQVGRLSRLIERRDGGRGR